MNNLCKNASHTNVRASHIGTSEAREADFGAIQ